MRQAQAAWFLPLSPYTLNGDSVNSSLRTNRLLAATDPGGQWSNIAGSTALSGKGSGQALFLNQENVPGPCSHLRSLPPLPPFLENKSTSSSLSEEVMGFPTNKTASVHQCCAAGSLRTGGRGWGLLVAAVPWSVLHGEAGHRGTQPRWQNSIAFCKETFILWS